MTETTELIRSLLVLVGPRISADEVADVDDWLDHREWGLAVDVLAEALSENAVTLTAREREVFVHILHAIGYDVTDFANLLAQ
ncbi:hypothetical protein SAMN05443575_1697 [Jatrophihabitans endophyticus]|uniref:MafI family immunity protein n=1 Tax=Jatrophihabitans endophyticus TaxID=1206085 RepID=A0A1M5HZ92_9ACTN|nr:hypothetical protein [Jatrophihabitans endophyticus]SHG21386.1 hypothetical protein SAMN05443575_1697 [Jatrophihabitans endophyticus]